MVITLKLDKNVKKSGLQTVYFQLTNGKSNTKAQVRKFISTGIQVEAKQFDIKNFRAKPNHSNQEIINEALRKHKDRKRVCETKFEAGLYTIDQVINHLKGSSDVNCVDDYLHNVIKESRTYTTYTDYVNTLNAFKKHLGFDRERLINFNELGDFRLLMKFKQALIKANRSNNTIRSYFTKIRVIMNDAYDNNFIFDQFKLNKKLRVPKNTPQPKSIGVEQFIKGIEKCKNIYEAQAVGFWLLMFGCRGLYPADIPQIKKTDLRDSLKSVFYSQTQDDHSNADVSIVDDGINKLIQTGENFLIHKRSKNRNRSNVPLIIRLNIKMYRLFIKLKLSVILTHYNKPHLLGVLDDNLSIFDYDIDNKYHPTTWSDMSKKCKRLTGSRFMDARKTFDSQALRLSIPADIREVLIGHKSMRMLQYYDDLSVIENEVHKAHLDVLKAFEFDSLVKLLERKFNKIDKRISLMSPPYGKYVDMLKSNIDWSLIKPPTEPINCPDEFI